MVLMSLDDERKTKYGLVWLSDERKENLKRGFCQMQGIDGTAVIDRTIHGTHVNIKRPSVMHGHVYCNRKGDYSNLVQAVYDHQKKFIDVFCGKAGSVYDARMLKKSSLYDRGCNR
ncbi:hypothetical protein Zmor_006156 [Zophobas morio]|uniref:DDE Tnp4 domain-containing protein n=1 Tax=Zophobas morio TaxID=2755281 RepID=A0AA38IUF5_9CUCU|nr:hypothetical protein Zmor_006156 [Zophobas morio]